ncbi:unnamed protein product [Paramecium sonneborni]|uniref:Uncharacterized protein n=1 Tax=Paramecium sonneborni TaxID=65129 RepID=A0A8S1R9Q3_9CILI|nr:unnamed protein product [Paramecium sonneborni]
MPKHNIKSGRPNKNDINDMVYKDEGYIATNEFALQLYQLISEMSNYKILTITGPSKQKNAKKNVKNRKEIEKKQGIIRKKLDIKEEKVFLLRNQEDQPRKYRIIDGKMVDNDEIIYIDDLLKYVQEDHFMKSIKMVFKELNEETQYFLKELVKIFSKTDKSLGQFQEQFFQLFESSPSSQYKEIKQWNELFEISFDEKLFLMQNEIDLFKKRFQLKINEEASQKKVEQKRIDIFKNQQSNIDQYICIKQPNRPLKLFIKKIYQLFHKFWILDEIQ